MNTEQPILLNNRMVENPWLETPRIDEWKMADIDLETILERYQPISLDEMETVALQNRVDIKYVMPLNVMQNTLSALVNEYRILVVKDKPFNHHRTLYFDTPGFAFFNMHVNGQAERYKVRSREYLDTRSNFLEVKHKTRKNRTVKKRLATRLPLLNLNGEASQWVDGIIPQETGILEPKICNTFTRITLVSLERCERVTIDMNIAFYNANHLSLLEGVAVAEVKMDRQDLDSAFKRLMHEQHVHTHKFSKYCIGASLLYESLKKNSLKESLLFINKTTHGVVK